MKKMTNLLFGALALLFACTDSKSSADDGIYADIKTSKGTITVKLEYEKAPVTVANFVSLAEGTNPFVKEQYKGKKYYDGLKFHRVIADFMIQGGCPQGTGSGEPGYKFIDEITDLKHHRAGTLSMANSGPKTNGSQFFITHKDTPWLDGKHTVFGYVTQGQDVVDEIAQNDVIESVTIIRKGKNAKKFDAAKVFSDHFKAEAEAQEKAEAQARKVKEQKKAFLEMNRTKATKTKSGLEFVVIEQGSQIKPTQEQEILVEYSGFLEDGTLFDTSVEQVAREFGIYNPQRPYQPFPYTLSNKIGLIPGFIEGLDQLNINDKAMFYIPSHLGYGEKGAGNFIPPNANLIFEVKILEKK